ncbi:class I SAM-dependent methyltransferase [Kitasatospora sp. McL0602]|uniref:class I SAM-dependent methyltransferase n=1 Tax=Kitasatospora sp. McL0602 TaxID=3439530 RepID=UPI003F8C5EFB
MAVALDEYLRLDPLQTRIDTHRRHSQHPDDVEQAAIAQLRLRAGESLLDIGSGTGSFLARLRAEGHQGTLIGLDSSPAAALACAQLPEVGTVVADAVQLPFHDGRFDAVTARHMLYHVSDVPAALREARRVLRPGGRLVAVVNHPDPVPRVGAVVREQAERHGVAVPVSVDSGVHSGTLPAQLARVFGEQPGRPSRPASPEVVIVSHDNALVFDAPEPVIAFGQALMSSYGVDSAFPERAAIAAGIDQQVRAWFAANSGPWRDPKGYVVCTAVRR